MKKLVITNVNIQENTKIFCGLHDESKFYQVNFFDNDNENDSAIGDIYVGRVKDVVKNISAAFIEYKQGCTGYFSLEENSNVIFLNNKNTDKLCEGDLIIVQVKKSAIKTKFPVLTSNISIIGRSIVLNVGKNGIGFSGKIKDSNFKSNINTVIGDLLDNYTKINKENYGLIIRTNAINLELDEIASELDEIISKWDLLKKTAFTRKCYSLLSKSDSQYLKVIKGLYKNEIDEIITDVPSIYDDTKKFLLNENIEISNSVTLYEDSLLPLYKLYSIENLINEVTSKKVWLKSGAYLVIEITEAMTVIDVNTGKCIKGKNLEETIVKVNLEAAEEIAFQMRLRNLSGIIMIDFINMSKKENQKSLVNYLEKLVNKDRIKTSVVDITKLDIVEVTRMKTEPPVFEQLK